MKLHEYQAKALFRAAGIDVPDGLIASTVDEAVDAATRLDYPVAIKAQVHAGGRGKGGGVKIAKSLDEVREHAKSIIGMNLVTHQTGPEGKEVHKVLVEQGIFYPGESDIREFYVSVLLNKIKKINFC